MRDAGGSPEVLAPDVLRALAREHLAGVDDVHVEPDIPPRKLRGARETHALHLLLEEPVVLLYDATFLGGAEHGFVVTPSRLCWKNYLDHPRSARWDDLAHVEISVRGSNIELGRGMLTAPVTDRVAGQVHAFLDACCRRTLAGAAPYRDLARGRGPTSFADVIVSAARRALGEVDWVHYAPSIPPRMIRAARIVHGEHLRPRETILVLYDDTVLGSGNDGVVLTEAGVRWRNFWSAAEALAWVDMEPERITVDRDQIFFDADGGGDERRRIDLRMRPGMASHVAGALREIARASRAGRETAPLR
jgi:hypothetical protein